MKQNKYIKAKAMLLSACNSYINHYAARQEELIGHLSYELSSDFLQSLLGKKKPDTGFNDWLVCEYAMIKHYCLLLNGNNKPRTREQLLWEKEKDTVSAENVLDMLNLLTQHLEEIFTLKEEDTILQQLKTKFLNSVLKEKDCHENDLDSSTQDLVSQKLFVSLDKLKTLEGLVSNFEDWICPIGMDLILRSPEQFKKDLYKKEIASYASSLSSRLYFFYFKIESYMKVVAVSELRDTLQDDLLPKEQLKNFEKCLKKGHTLKIIQKDNESSTEHALKILSVISILVGIGIFTTLGLVCKRLYDTQGRSCNFFKSRSKEFCEAASKIIDSTCKSEEQESFEITKVV